MKTKYECEICKRHYDTAAEAMSCELQEQSPAVAEVGDIILLKAGYGRYDGDKRWIENPTVTLRGNQSHGNCFGSCCTFQFFYVVTAIDRGDDQRDAHRRRYHCFTKAMSGREGYESGYTFDEYHVTPRKVENPPEFIVKDSKDLIGKKANYLL